MKAGPACPCGSGRDYAACCAPFHFGEKFPSTAEALMRSRYSAYALRLEDYLLATWHPTTRPSELDLAADGSRWLALEIRHHGATDADHATVDFVARYRIAGRGYRLHEISRFLREDGRWYYIDGQIRDK